MQEKIQGEILWSKDVENFGAGGSRTGMKMMGKKEGKEGTQREERGRNDDTAGRRTWKNAAKNPVGECSMRSR